MLERRVIMCFCGQLMDTAQVSYTMQSFALNDLENPVWEISPAVEINKYWSGAEAESGRRTRVNLLWNEQSLRVRFRGNQTEPLVVNSKPDARKKAINLWNGDVCEIFVAPDADEPEKYFEFEAAPTGEWVDLKIRQLPDRRETDFQYVSRMKTCARIAEREIVVAIEIEWAAAFGRKPDAGERWRGNLFRCVGAGASRGYLAWQPTLTAIPNFHVPERFGYFEFVK